MKKRDAAEKYGFAYASPLGTLHIICTAHALREIKYSGDAQTCTGVAEPALAARIRAQLDEYFAKQRTDFDLPLEARGTEFQKKVWDALCAIPYGETRSYGEIAASIGNKNACRAVGMANHNNPIAIVIPCHRVVGANGKLTGYAGGLATKEALLRLETKAGK